MGDVPATAVEDYLGNLRAKSFQTGSFRGPTYANSLLQRGFEEENWVTSLVRHNQFQDGLEDEDGYNAFIQDKEVIERYPMHAQAFTESGSGTETQRIVAQIELERSNRESLSGASGFLAMMAGAAADPLNLAFVGATGIRALGMAGRAAALARKAPGIGRVAGLTAAEGFVVSLWSEIELQDTQLERTGAESALNIASGTILGGLFGGGFAALGKARPAARRLIRQRLAEAGDSTVGAAKVIEEDIRAHYEIPDGELTGDFLSTQPDADVTRTYLDIFEKRNPDGVQVIKNLNSPIGRALRIFGFGWNPMGRGSTAKAGKMRIATRKLAETGWVTDDLDQIAKIGPSVEANLQVMYMRAAVAQQDGHAIFKLYKEAGDELDQLPKLLDFNEATGRALRNDDKAGWLKGKAKDRVEQNARNIRKFFDGVRDDAIRVGLMTDMDLRGTASSYFTRVYNMDKIGADPAEFEKWLVEYGGLDINSARDAVVHIEGLPTGSASFEGLRRIPSSVRRRLLEVEDEELFKGGWLINDVDHVIPRFAHGILPEIELAKAFPVAASNRVVGLLRRLQAVEKTSDPFEIMLLKRRADLLEVSQRLTYKHGHPKVAQDLENLMERLDSMDRMIKAHKEAGHTRAPKGSKTGPESEQEIRREIRRIIKELNKTLPKEQKVSFPQNLAKVEKLGELSERQIKRHLVELNDQVSSVRRRQAMRAVEMDDVISGINAQYREMRDVEASKASNESLSKRERKKARNEVRRLKIENTKRIDDLTFIRDKLRNKHMIQRDGVTNMLQAESALMKLNFMTMLGGVVVSSLPDLAMPIFVNGLRPWARAMMQMGNPIKAIWKGSDAEGKEELIRMLRALELLSSSRIHQMADIFDAPSAPGKIGGAIDAAAETFTKATLINRWNGYMKGVAAMASMNRIIDDISGLKSGKLVGRRAASARQKLHLSGISDDFHDDILEMLGKHAEEETINGVRVTWPRTQLWAEGLEGAERARVLDIQSRFRGAVVTDVRKTILTPSAGGAPRFMSAKGFRVLTQFKRFSVEATNRILLSGMQRRDMAVLNGVIAGAFMGSTVYAAKETIAGRELSDDPGAWVFESIDRAGLLGLAQELNNVTERITRGRFGLAPMLAGDHMASRFTGRNLSDAVLGPSLGRVEDALQLGASFSEPEGFDSFDTRRIRRMVPFQNLFYAKWLFNSFENGANSAFGIGPRATRAQR